MNYHNNVSSKYLEVYCEESFLYTRCYYLIWLSRIIGNNIAPAKKLRSFFSDTYKNKPQLD